MKYLKYSIIFILGFFLSSCGDSTEPKTKLSPEIETNPIGEEVYGKAKDIFYSLPSPIEMTTLLKTNGGEFREDIILNPDKANDFITLQNQAIALGIYGADLSYAALFDQKQEALKLLAATKRVASKLGIEEAYSAENIERANAHLSNRDSVLSILTDVYWETNAELKENGRNEMAMVILGAGWAEGIYIGSSLLASGEKDPDLVNRMIEQKFAATELQNLFVKYAENEVVAESYELFAPLLDVYATIDVSSSGSTMKKDETSGKFVIGGTTEMNYDQEDIEQIIKAAFTVRKNMIGR